MTKFTVPLPHPPVAGASVIQPASVVAVHAHPLVVVTAILPDTPVKPTICAPGATTNLHPVGSGVGPTTGSVGGAGLGFGPTAGDVGSELGPTTGDEPPQPGAARAVAKTRTDRAAAM